MSSVVNLFNKVSEEPEFQKSTVDLFDKISPKTIDTPKKPVMERLDPVSAELRKLGHEPDSGEESERLAEAGTANVIKSLLSIISGGGSKKIKALQPEPESEESTKEFAKGTLSGATIGLSEKISGLKPEEGIESSVGEFAGSVLPISRIYNVVGRPLATLASKSPYAKKSLQALASMTGFGLTGSAYESGKKVVKEEELPTPEEMLTWGAEWAAFDGALQALGAAGRFSKQLGQYAIRKKIPQKQALEDVLTQVKQKGIEIEKSPEQAVKSAEQILNEVPKEKVELENIESQKGTESADVKPLDIEKPSNASLAETPIQQKMPPEKLEIAETQQKPAQLEIKKAKETPVEKRTPEQTQVIAESELAKPDDSPEKLFENAPLPDNPSFSQRARNIFLKPKSAVGDKVWKMKEDYYGKKAFKLWESRRKWNKELKQQKFSQKELSDMQFYVENPEAFGKKKGEKATGNPFIGAEDTYEALEGRLSEKAKRTVKDVIEPHFEEWRKLINDSAYTKKINPRDFLEGVYIPHFYSGDTKKGAKQAAEILSKRFNTNNPFANKRTFLTYNEALQKAEMKPRYDNISDVMNEYDRVMTRVLVNSELAGQMADLEKEIGQKLILRSNNKAYGEAKREGWVPFDDPYLRRHIAGKDEAGKPIFATLDTPALVHPEIADALNGIFIKDSRGPQESWIGWKGYDALSDKLKSIHVGFSPFHYVALAEESGKSSGLNLIKSFKKGGKLLEDPIFMKDYLEAGGTIHENPEISKVAHSSKNIETELKLKGGAKQKVGEGIKYFREFFDKPSKFLFEEVQPRWKVSAFYDMRARELEYYTKKGVALTADQKKQLSKEIGSLVNDMFGGQNFELMRNPTTLKAFDLSDPGILKKWRRYGGYVDWSISAAKEFGKTATGLKEVIPGTESSATGRRARANFLRYGRNLFMSQQMLNYFFTGLYNKSDGSVGWDINKSHSTFENDDPKKWWSFQLPDVKVKLLGRDLNFGRDQKGRRLYSHFGKKLFEIAHYATDPVAALFNKSNPVAQLATVQVLGGTPSLEHGVFPAQGTFKEGKFMPWQGEKGLSQAASRSKELAKTLLPFSGQRFVEEGWAAFPPYIATFGGAVPISKGISLSASEEYFEKYLKDPQNNRKEIENLKDVLKDQGYKMEQINRTVSKIRNRLKKQTKEE